MKNFKIIAAVLVLPMLFAGCGEEASVTIGTGAITGLFYPTGSAICLMVNQNPDVHGLKLDAEPTPGSVYNVDAVIKGDLEFAIVQSDRQYQAVNGLAEWKDRGPQDSLRSVFSLHPEAVTLVAAVESGIQSVEDLIGKRVNLGNEGSGPLQNARDILQAFDISEGMLVPFYAKALDAPGMMQNGEIDAFFFTVGHPSINIREAASGLVPVRLIPVSGKEKASLLTEKPYYTDAVIQKSYYPHAQNTNDIETIGVRATLIASADVADKIVYTIVKVIFEHLSEFRTLHPAFAGLTKENMLEGLSAPLHPGAKKYYIEAGLLPGEN